MNSGLLKLNLSDVAKGLVVAVIAVVLGALQQAITAHGFDFAAYDWSMILHLAETAGGSYIAKNFLSTSDGRVAGIIG